MAEQQQMHRRMGAGIALLASMLVAGAHQEHQSSIAAPVAHEAEAAMSFNVPDAFGVFIPHIAAGHIAVITEMGPPAPLISTAVVEAPVQTDLVPAALPEPQPLEAVQQSSAAPKPAIVNEVLGADELIDPEVDAVFERLVQCEASGNWHINTGNGFFGGLQFDQATWESNGGDAFAERADLATPHQQKVIAQRVFRNRGWGPWPGCKIKLGL